MSEASYRVFIDPAAQKQLRKMDAVVRRRISAAIDTLALNPRPDGCRALTGYAGTYRIRVGDYRVIYQVRDSELVVYIVRVGNRGEIYR